MTQPSPSESAERLRPWFEIEVDGSELVADPYGDDEVDHLRQLVGLALRDRRGPRTIVVGLRFVGPDEMAELNALHLGRDGPTDVLSFPIDGDPAEVASGDDRWEARAGRIGVERTAGGSEVDQPPWLLGDIVICPAVAAANAPTHAGSTRDELALLVVHGLLHLLGMDHADAGKRAAMQARERELLTAHHGPMARDPWDPA